jgi:hypothetical protein
MTATGWIGGGSVDEFDKADMDDYLIDRADEHELRQRDWDELHVITRGFVSFYEACADMGRDRAEAARETP